MTDPRVTIIVVPREQFSKARASLESIYAATAVPFDLVYVDGNSPPALRQYLETQAAARRFTLVRTERYLTSNEARNIGARYAGTPYIAFVDNDVFVQPGWLTSLLRCADETGAAVVGPLYCFGADGASGEPVVVHTAGAELRIVDDGGRRLHEVHRQVDRLVADVLPELRREPIDLVEFHCMLVRRELLGRTGALDEQLLSFYDHLDFCMAAREAGGSVYFEPASVVTQLVPPPLAWMDVPFFLLRWSNAWLEPSARHFAAKHGLAQDDKELRDHIWFRNDHRRRMLAGPRRALRAVISERMLRRVDKVMDRVVFGGVVEYLVARPMQRRRARAPAAEGTAAGVRTPAGATP
ncbi:MAG TPA: glycosyltransferase [Gemmatimonadales bacterium]|nr:glycosyltransferase [Gemmatimonadales bacterium]